MEEEEIDPFDHFTIYARADYYSGKWVVFRNRDNKAMTESHNLKEMLAWVRTWGPTRL